MLKRKHNYYCRVQQQLFALPERLLCDFVVCGIAHDQKVHIIKDHIYPDVVHCQTVLSKLEDLYTIRDSGAMVQKEVHVTRKFTRW